MNRRFLFSMTGLTLLLSLVVAVVSASAGKLTRVSHLNGGIQWWFDASEADNKKNFLTSEETGTKGVLRDENIADVLGKDFLITNLDGPKEWAFGIANEWFEFTFDAPSASPAWYYARVTERRSGCCQSFSMLLNGDDNSPEADGWKSGDTSVNWAWYGGKSSKDLVAIKNVVRVIRREGKAINEGDSTLFDITMVSTVELTPTDADYQAAQLLETAVKPTGKLAITWGIIKNY